MLSAGLCHLLPQALPEIQPSVRVEDCELVKVKDFPTATFLCGLGLALTLVIDQIAEAASISFGVGHVDAHTEKQKPTEFEEGKANDSHETSVAVCSCD